MHIQLCVYMCVYIYIYIHTYIHTHIHMYYYIGCPASRSSYSSWSRALPVSTCLISSRRISLFLLISVALSTSISRVPVCLCISLYIPPSSYLSPSLSNLSPPLYQVSLSLSLSLSLSFFLFAALFLPLSLVLFSSLSLSMSFPLSLSCICGYTHQLICTLMLRLLVIPLMLCNGNLHLYPARARCLSKCHTYTIIYNVYVDP